MTPLLVLLSILVIIGAACVFDGLALLIEYMIDCSREEK